MKKLIAVTTILFAWMVLGATPVLADQFKVGILLDPAVTDSSFMEGFQLAVDQSPDISHPAGVEGGDHLGGIDVEMVIGENTIQVEDFIVEALKMLEVEMVDMIITDVSPEILGVMFPLITESSRVLIAMSDIGENNFKETLFFFPVAGREGAGDLLTDKTLTFEDAFLEEYNRAPSETETRGYIAGRIIDIAVGATNNDPSNLRAFNNALLGAVGAPIPEVAIGAEESEPQPTPNSSNSKTRTGIIILFISILIASGVFSYLKSRDK